MADATRQEAQAFLEAWFETRRVVQAFNFNRFQQEGLSATQFILLTMLGEAGPDAAAPSLSSADLARRLNVNVTTTMRTAESLIGRGLVCKAADPADRRRSLLYLTAAGRQAHARIEEAFIAQTLAAFGAIAPALRASLVDGLRAFVRAAAGGIP